MLPSGKYLVRTTLIYVSIRQDISDFPQQQCTGHRRCSQDGRGKQVISVIGLLRENLTKKNCSCRHAHFPSIFLWSHPSPPPFLPGQLVREVQGTSVQCSAVPHYLSSWHTFWPQGLNVTRSEAQFYQYIPEDNYSIKKQKYQNQFNGQ